MRLQKHEQEIECIAFHDYYLVDINSFFTGFVNQLYIYIS